MSLRPYAGAQRALLVVTLAGLMVSACASTPGARNTRTAPKTVGPAYGRMAPIPNPTDAPARPAVRPAPRAAGSAEPRASAPTRPAPAPAPAPKAPALSDGRDPAKARVLRAKGLEQLNRGAIDKAQDLLRQALRLDPGDALIQRDLDRATRIGQAVRARP